MNFDKSLENFLSVVTDNTNEYYKTNYSNLTPPVYVNLGGRKYNKIVSESENSESVYCFVEKSTGLIYKPAGYRAPAKGARGSIYEPATFKNFHLLLEIRLNLMISTYQQPFVYRQQLRKHH